MPDDHKQPWPIASRDDPESVTMLAVLVSGAAAELACLGVTSVALLRGDQTVGQASATGHRATECRVMRGHKC
jgi:hypothetical protein